VVQAVWQRMSSQERARIHRVTCLHSNATADLDAIQAFICRLQVALGALRADDAGATRH
jgi:hypothetical protein